MLDFSCNKLVEVPRGIKLASGLLVLNLSDNELTSVPMEIFTDCTELMLLDLSDNQLTSLPAHLRRCTSLQQLILDRNPLQHYQPRTIVSLKNLEVSLTLLLSSSSRTPIFALKPLTTFHLLLFFRLH